MNKTTAPARGTKPHAGLVSACILLLLLSVALPSLASASTSTVIIPSTPTTAPTHAPGYVWNQNPGQTHVALALNDPTHIITLSTLPLDTKRIDLEVTGLPIVAAPGLFTLTGMDAYQLNQTFTSLGTTDGRVIFWSLPALPTQLTLLDAGGHTVMPVAFSGQVACSDARACLAAIIMRASTHKGVATNTTLAPVNATRHKWVPASPPPPSSPPQGGAATASSSGGPTAYTWCANENNYCSFSGTHTVAYGANGYWYYKYNVNSGINCDNADFGDPDVGTYKACYYDSPPPPSTGPPSGYTWCANENSACSFQGTMTVAYGANGYYNYKSFTNGVMCDNNHFGDPDVGTGKACYTSGTPSSQTGGSGGGGSYSDYGPSGMNWCADEGSTCYFSGTRDVAYGYDGYYNYQTNVQGSIGCGNGVFGDPYSGHGKSCYYGADKTSSGGGGSSNPPAQTNPSGSGGGGNSNPPAKANTGGGTHGPQGGGNPSSSYGPQGSAYCAHENDWCSVSGTQTVAYGASGTYYYKTVNGGGIWCDNADFGDPIPYTVKDCYIMNAATSGPTYDTTTGLTTEQGVISSTNYATVSVTGCWGHQVDLEASVSGGMAAQAGAGGTYSYQFGNCDTITSQPSTSFRESLDDSFERASYQDGSTSVWATSKGMHTTVAAWSVSASCASGGKSCFQSVTVANCATLTRTAHEAGSTGAYVEGGYETPVWNVKGRVTLGVLQDSTITWSLNPNADCNTHTFYLASVAGDTNFNTQNPVGLIGIVTE